LAKAISKIFKVALVGGETLLGRELKEVVEGRGAGARIATYAATGEGNFGEEQGEPVYVEALEAEAVRGARAILVAGSREGALKAYAIAKSGGGNPVLIDCTGQLEDQPEARLVAPLLEEPKPDAGWLLVIAHPAASALALVLTRLAKYRLVRQAVVHIFEPASERGKKGLTELHQQTTGLLAFKPLEKKVFDAQLSFNLLAQYGEEAPSKLLAVEQRIEGHVATVLSRQTATLPIPSIRVIQAPVFHAYSLSLWIEFDGKIAAREVGEALASAQIEVRGPDEEPPNGVGAAGQSGVMVGDIRLDPNNSRAVWLWVVADNLRVMADSAADWISALGSAE
jgi:aspartate-semialdehyde dehydrogenase